MDMGFQNVDTLVRPTKQQCRTGFICVQRGDTQKVIAQHSNL